MTEDEAQDDSADESQPTTFSNKLTTVYHGCSDLAQRWAVLVPCCGPARGDGTDDQIRGAVAELIYQRRMWFAELRKLGWSYLRRGKNWIYAWNCPPVTVRVGRRSIPCHQKLVCPFCWGRHYALDTYLRLEHLFCDGRRLSEGAGITIKPLGLDLIEVYTTSQYEADQTAADLLEQVRLNGNRLVRSRRHRGAFMLNAVVPTSAGWQIEQRVLWVVPSFAVDERQIAELAHTSEHVTRTARATYVTSGSDLAAAAARVCRYPEQLLQAKPRRVVELLEAHAGSRQRLSAYYGGLRNESERKRRAEWIADAYEMEGDQHDV